MSGSQMKERGKKGSAPRSGRSHVDLARLESMSLAEIGELWRALGGRRRGATGRGDEREDDDGDVETCGRGVVSGGGGGVPRRVMVRDIAYCVQSRRFGTLDKVTKRLLKLAIRDAIASASIAEPLASTSDPAADKPGSAAAPAFNASRVARPRSTRPPLPAGAKLIRTWRGRTHEVTVVQGGKAFVYQGKTYRSLSSISTEITGMVWSGPQFFGLVTLKNKHYKANASSGNKGAAT